MRIGLLTEAYLPLVSGVTRFVALHKEALERMGHEPYVFTFGERDAAEEQERIIRSPAIPLSDSGYYLSFSFDPHARALCKTMDVFHTQHPFLVGRLALRYGERYGIPTVYTNHTRYDLYAHYYAPVISEGLGAAFLQAYLPRFTSSCDAVITPSRSIRDLLASYGVTRHIEVIPNGIDTRRFQEPAGGQVRRTLGIPEGARVLIHLGRLAPEKRIHLVLRAFAAVAGDLPDTYLVIVGDGPERKGLEEQAALLGLESRIRFPGSVPYDQVPSYLSVGDAFATASITEVHPLSLLEAIAAGLPVLGIESPGVGDIIQDGRNGLLSGDDLAEFSVRLYRLMSDDGLRQRLAAQAKQDSAQYDIRATTSRIVGCYEEAISRYRRRHEAQNREHANGR